jgi:citrate lyase subunit beta / citryl-CoA lyase
MSPDLVTLLFVPADRPQRYLNAAASGADAIIIDLEDAVSPDAKASAREALVRPGALPQNITIFVRVNHCVTPWYSDDVAAVSSLGVAGVILPKVETPAEIDILSAALPGMPIVAMIESARGVAGAREIAEVEAVARLAFGSWDFCTDIGASHTPDALLAARSEIVLASRINNLPSPIDGVCTAIDDAEKIECEARYAQTLGFGGKLCIHPRQIRPVRRGFAPSAAELSWARRILASEGEGAVSVDGTMVDAPVRTRARQLIARVAAAEESGV